MIKTPLSTMIGGAFWTPSATILGGTSKTFDRIIQSLFANGEQGFVYDPNDLSTMFQDAAGTVPVTGVGQPVGLMLDKSKWLSTLDGYLSTTSLDFTTWSKTPAVVSTSKLSFTTSGAGGCYKALGFPNKRPAQIRLAGTCTASWYLFNPENNDGFVSVPNGAFDIVSNNAAIFSTQGSLYFSLVVAGTLTITSVSVEELSGNHAYQTTSSMRPLLVASPQRLDYDIADDKLITTLPTQLTGCTVIRSVPNVGTQILTGQTIPTPYNDNTDHCGLIVINRALTPSETSAITAEFNKRAGV